MTGTIHRKRRNLRYCVACPRTFIERDASPDLPGEPAWICPVCAPTMRCGLPHNRNDNRGWDDEPELIGDTTLKY